jgi:NADPH:quinone reductase-like Zn-dependent oxidoreductase
LIGIQFAKLSGFGPIIVTASLKHTDYLKSLGAANVLDRNLSLPDLKSEIEKITPQPIKYIYDCVSSSETQATAIEILGPGGNLIIANSPNVTSPDRNIIQVVAIRQLEFNLVPITTLCAKLTQLVENRTIKV